MAEGDTVINAILGAAVTVILAGLLPFSPIFGGGVAGYLQGGDRSTGLRIGIISGLIAFVPAVLVGFLALALLSAVFLGGGIAATPFAVLGFGGFLLVVAFVVGLVYVVGLSALGGWLGNYLKHDTDYDL